MAEINTTDNGFPKRLQDYFQFWIQTYILSQEEVDEQNRNYVTPLSRQQKNLTQLIQ